MKEKDEIYLNFKDIEEEIAKFLNGFSSVRMKCHQDDSQKTENAACIAPLAARIQYFLHVLEDYQENNLSPRDILNHFADVFDDVVYYEEDEEEDDCDTSD